MKVSQNIGLSIEMAKDLDEESKNTGKSKSNIVEIALIYYFDKKKEK